MSFIKKNNGKFAELLFVIKAFTCRLNFISDVSYILVFCCGVF